MLLKLLREPLAHFLALGFILFVLFNAISGGRGGADHRIVINDAMVANLVLRHQSAWQRPPTPAELAGLVESQVREEILYREGIARGLDRDDPVIRRRVVQKLDVLSEELAVSTAPGDAELEGYLQQNAARYARPTVIGFEQIVFDPNRHRERFPAVLNDALARLKAGTAPDQLGDRTMLPITTPAIPADLLARDYGEGFATAVLALPVGAWQGPVRSGYGQHLVRVTRKTPGRAATLAEVRVAVERDWENDRRVQAKERYYQNLRKNYEVIIDAVLPEGARPGVEN